MKRDEFENWKKRDLIKKIHDQEAVIKERVDRIEGLVEQIIDLRDHSYDQSDLIDALNKENAGHADRIVKQEEKIERLKKNNAEVDKLRDKIVEMVMEKK